MSARKPGVHVLHGNVDLDLQHTMRHLQLADACSLAIEYRTENIALNITYDNGLTTSVETSNATTMQDLMVLYTQSIPVTISREIQEMHPKAHFHHNGSDLHNNWSISRNQIL
jgi:hypothetical protein